MLSVDDFSTNRFSYPTEVDVNDEESISSSEKNPHSESLSRHPDLCFSDGNLAVLTGAHYFLVHQGLIRRHSAPLARVIDALEGTQTRFLEGRVVLELAEPSDDVYYFLLALYDGISALKYNAEDFPVVAAILRLATAYEVKHLRTDILRGLSFDWPTSLAQWEIRESRAHVTSLHEPRKSLPHPILVINLARTVNAPELLPVAFYDLSRSPPSTCAAGYILPHASSPKAQHLCDADLLALLRGKEHASRFLSTFIVSELEGRPPSASCAYLTGVGADHGRRRMCQSAFEMVTFEVLRDARGRSSDPLSAIMEAELMQTRGEGPVVLGMRACEWCRAEFGAAVDSAREEFWARMPEWFGVDVGVWG
ncbi:hypothetical protein H0H81_011356 [Sphagnurus paluster]|uniref:BTB domain-containing protein n=1 Tax=Sphagnurus paluster TaxID=117069 RepID=A0A9P7G194_9AGAR|nr:hypothetical protein H0H81_011356 [Sphagnurus paluster]